MKVAAQVLALFISLPIWFFLLYQILVRVNASELMWFLFWVYVPLGIFVQVVIRLTEKE